MARMGRVTRAQTAAIEVSKQTPAQGTSTLKRKIVDREELSRLTAERLSKIPAKDPPTDAAAATTTATKAKPKPKKRGRPKKKGPVAEPSEDSESAITDHSSSEPEEVEAEGSGAVETIRPNSPAATRPAHEKGKNKNGTYPFHHFFLYNTPSPPRRSIGDTPATKSKPSIRHRVQGQPRAESQRGAYSSARSHPNTRHKLAEGPPGAEIPCFNPYHRVSPPVASDTQYPY